MHKKISFALTICLICLSVSTGLLAQDQGFVINQNESSVHVNPAKTLYVTPLLTQANAPAANAYLGTATIKPGAKMPSHDHKASYEIHYIQSGDASVTIGDKSYKLTAGSVAYFPAHVQHSLVNGTEKDLVCIQIFSPSGNPTADARYFSWPTTVK